MLEHREVDRRQELPNRIRGDIQHAILRPHRDSYIRNESGQVDLVARCRNGDLGGFRDTYALFTLPYRFKTIA